MSQRLLFPDAHAAADAVTFSRRSVALGDGAVRLRAESGVLVMTSAPLAPRGLMDATPTVLGMRVLAVDPELSCDVGVEASALHIADDDARAVVLPAQGIALPWAGISPPRSGWVRTGEVRASTLAATAQAGIAEVAQQVPADAGEDVVRLVRSAVWGRTDDTLEGLPRGAAFAAFALGFIAGDEVAAVRRAGAWSRLTLTRGHVVVRGPARTGLTEVRATGGR